MTNVCRVDDANKRIVMDRTFAKNAAIVGSREYQILQDCRKNYEGYTVVRREIKKNASQKRYRGLTYKYMREYIIYKESPEQVVDVLGKLQDMMVLAACQSSAYRYPVIKQWFLNRYPEIVQFGMPEMKKEEENTPSLIIDEPVSIQELKNAS